MLRGGNSMDVKEDEDDDDKPGEEDEVMDKRGSAMDEDLVQYSTHVRQPFFEFVRLWQQHADSQLPTSRI
jgi:hypothetical protein